MRRAQPWLLNFSAALSLVMCVATTAAAIRSWYAFDEFYRWNITSLRHSTYSIGWDQSRFFFYYYGVDVANGSSGLPHHIPTPWLHVRHATTPRNKYPFALWTFEQGGPGWGRGAMAGTFDCFYRGGIAAWPLVALFALLPAIWVERSMTRAKPGFCTKCGYNLTANISGMCPECGTPTIR